MPPDDPRFWTEPDWEKQVVKHARDHGWLVHGTRAGRDRKGRTAVQLKGDPGFPDLVLCRPPHFIIIELKNSERAGAGLEQDQVKWIDAIAACGIKVDVVWVPREYDELIRRLVLAH